MNINQKFVAGMVTAALIVMIVVGMSYVDQYLTLEKELLKYLISALILLTWFFFLFIADLYMKINSYSKEVLKYQKQIHSKIIKRYTESCNHASS